MIATSRNAILAVLVTMTAMGLILVSRAQGQQGTTTVQLPTFGVAIDALGLLSVKSFPDPGGRLHAARVAAARSALPRDVAARSDTRMVSLLRLEKAVGQTVASGGQLDDVMQNLAGLQSVRYVFLYPDESDIVIAGPAEGWVEDAAGRHVGISTGRPTLRLEDLIVALRAYSPGSSNRPFIGCTIDPDPDGLARLQKFQQTIPRVIPQRARQQVAAQIAQGSRDSLGMADIRVFGISANTHFAQVMIEASFANRTSTGRRVGIWGSSATNEPCPCKQRRQLSTCRALSILSGKEIVYSRQLGVAFRFAPTRPCDRIVCWRMKTAV